MSDLTQEQESYKDLEDFIKKHTELLTAMGVFAGLTALFTSSGMHEIGTFLAFWTFSLFFLVSVELFSKFPKIESFDNRLVLFQILLLMLGICVFFYLLLVYTAYSLIFGCLFALLFGSAIITIYAKFAERHQTSGKVIGFFATVAFGIVAVFGILFLAFLIYILILYLLGLPIPSA